jgi:methane/ammonia monooxygenase subunit B
MTKRLAAVLLLGTIASTLVFASPASAHGEKSQEAFLRMRTVGWTDVNFTGGRLEKGRLNLMETHVKQGEFVTLRGVAKLMNTWPDTLAAGQPEIGYINIATQGPAVMMTERTINGVSTPGRIEIERGRYYSFEMKLMGRRPGRWHVHPSFAVKGAGTVLGPGQWVNVERTSGGFKSPVTLYNGKTINMENYGLNMVWIFQVVGFLFGLAWVVYWTAGKRNPDGSPKGILGGKRTVTNPAVTLSIPLNDDGVAVGLNTKRDHRVVNMFFVATSIFLLIGWIYQASAYPVKIPQQVVQFEPPPTALDAPPALAKVDPLLADYEPNSRKLRLEVNVTNISDSPITFAEYTTSTLTFIPAGGAATAPTGYQQQVQVSPSGPIQPGQTQKLTLAIDGNSLVEEHLVPTSESQLTMAGLMVFKDSTGKEASYEIEEPLRPRFKDFD